MRRRRHMGGLEQAIDFATWSRSLGCLSVCVHAGFLLILIPRVTKESLDAVQRGHLTFAAGLFRLARCGQHGWT